MDLFFASTEGAATQRRRVHFNAFMVEVQARLHIYNQSDEAKQRASRVPRSDLGRYFFAWRLCVLLSCRYFLAWRLCVWYRDSQYASLKPGHMCDVISEVTQLMVDIAGVETRPHVYVYIRASRFVISDGWHEFRPQN
jgi:hypothetical protein